MKKYIIYKRLSRDSKNGLNLGLEAQQNTIDSFLHSQKDFIILDNLEEIETGTRKKRRPIFEAAVERCQKEGATLLIAKLDRLARHLGTVTRLMDSKIDFLALDIMDASPLTIHIFAAMAEFEAKRISDRTKAVAQVLKSRGVKLGPKTRQLTAADSLPYRMEMIRRKKDKATNFCERIQPNIRALQNIGMTYPQIAQEFNRLGHETPTKKGKWYTTTVQRCATRNIHKEVV